ncbi:hypothetical protein CCP3SC1_470011 [Gammaproteobacteria bacterium]
MTAITETFIELFKRQPNETDKIRLMSVQKALRLPDDDPLWTILIALDYYQKLYEEAPAKILEATQIATRTSITAAEAATTEKLVNGALAIANERVERVRASQWPLVIVSVLLSIALIGFGVSFWFSAKQFQTQKVEITADYESKLATANERFNNKLRAAKEQYDTTLMTRVHEAESISVRQVANDMGMLNWANQYRDLYKDKNFQGRIDFATQNQILIDALRSLNAEQRENLIQIIGKADRWREIRSSTKLPWPCFGVINPNDRDNRNTTICKVGLEGDIAPPTRIASSQHPKKPPHPPRPPLRLQPQAQ